MSTVKVDTIKTTGNVEVYTCKAWVNFDGTTNTGGSCTIRASGNVSSVADNGAGDYTINFTNAMTDANYAVSGSAKEADSGTTDALFKIDEIGSNPAAGSVRINTGGATTSFDCNTVMASILS
jgi:hypothetical protein